MADLSNQRQLRGAHKVRKQDLYDEFFMCMKCLHRARTPLDFYGDLPGYLGAFLASRRSTRLIVENDFILGPDAYRFRHNWEVSGLGHRVTLHPHIDPEEREVLLVLEEAGPEVFFLDPATDGVGLTHLAQIICSFTERYAVNHKGRAGLIVGAALRRPEWELTLDNRLTHMERIRMLTRVEALGAILDTQPDSLAEMCPADVARVLPSLLESTLR